MREYAGQSDGILVEKTLLGDSLAYEELVRRHEASVKGTAYKVTGNYFFAEDASQDAFVSAWVHLATLKDWDKFGSWVCSIAKNHAKGISRSYNYAQADISLDIMENIDLYDPNGDVIELVSSKDESARLHEAVNSLSEKIGQVISLHYFEGLKVDEIAERLSTPCGTVKWRLREGRKQLRKEFGIMENTCNENKAFVKQVMRRVEELKLWRLKNSHEGFEIAYKEVLASVEELKESKEKSHALADVLNMGYWWLESEKTDSNKDRIEKAAIEGHNEDVMTSLVSSESSGLSGQGKIDYMQFTQLPKLEKHGFIKPIGYIRFWMGYEYLMMDDCDKAKQCFKSCLELTEPSNAYYAAAHAAVNALKRRLSAREAHDTRILGMCVTGETYKIIGGKLYFWNQPGFCDDMLYNNYGSVFAYASRCDSLTYDPDMRCKDKIVSSNGRYTLTFTEEDARVITSAGQFEGCRVYELTDGADFCTTWFCPGVGIVKQQHIHGGSKFEWTLCDYTIKGGSGLLPMAAGNRWVFTTSDGIGGIISDTANIYEVTYADSGTVVCASEVKLYCDFDLNTSIGCLSKAGSEFEAGENVTEIKDITDYIKRADMLAVTEKDRLITKVFTEVHNRILETEISCSPDCCQVGRQNGFDIFGIERNHGEIMLTYPYHYCNLFQYLMTYQTADAYKSWYNTLYSTISRACRGVIWSDSWTPGYHSKRMEVYYGDSKGNLYPVELSVLEDESVMTPAGYFENCRHLRIENMAEMADNKCYCGVFDLWYAKGVGLVKMSRPLWKFVENIWWLTEYKGIGKDDSYFPVENGFFRRYESKDLGGGWTSSVEYTYSSENGEDIIVVNMTANQERKIFEKEEAARREREGR